MNQKRPDSGTARYLEQVARNNLSDLIDSWYAAGEPEKARACAELAVRQGIWSHPQQRDRDHVSGLTAAPLHDPAQFWFVGLIEERFPEIQAEIRSFPHLPACLFRDGRWLEEVCVTLPVTRGVLEQIPELTTFNPGVIEVSHVPPGAYVSPRCGPTNALLRVQVPIVAAPGAWMRVADQTVTWQEGRCVVFDDSFEHEVRHEGSHDPTVLLNLDLAHPDLDPAHRARLLADRLTPEESITALMRERGIAEVSYHDGQLTFLPDAQMRELIDQYMHAADVSGVRVEGDRVSWLHPASAVE